MHHAMVESILSMDLADFYARLMMHMPHGRQFTSGRVKIFTRFFKQFIN